MTKLSIILPAYNEEDSIRDVLEQTIAAKEVLKNHAGLKDVEIILVDDGSRDRTLNIAKEYSDKNLVHLLRHEKNRGYGAAIKTGFKNASGDLLSFFDTDGTCNPLSLQDLLQKMKQTDADLVIGARLNPGSKMPLTRKIGNLFYRQLVNAIAASNVTDIASGMRIIKKDAIKHLYPLPDGLHFTPAMSVRAILDRNIRIEEVPIPYRERAGRSKLSVVKDGLRFLKIILEIAFTYKPLRLFGAMGACLLLVALLYSVGPLLHYLEFRNVPEDRIYRLIFVIVAAVSGFQLISVGVITQSVTNLIHGYEMETMTEKVMNRTFLARLAYIGSFFLIAAILLNWNVIVQYATTRHIYVHWSYVVAGGLLVLLGIQLLAFSIINRIITVLKEQKVNRKNPS